MSLYESGQVSVFEMVVECAMKVLFVRIVCLMFAVLLSIAIDESCVIWSLLSCIELCRWVIKNREDLLW